MELKDLIGGVIAAKLFGFLLRVIFVAIVILNFLILTLMIGMMSRCQNQKKKEIGINKMSQLLMILAFFLIAILIYSGFFQSIIMDIIWTL